jgi:hypothetical protein
MRKLKANFSGIYNTQQPNTVLATELKSGMRVTLIVKAEDGDSFSCGATISQTFHSTDGKFIRVYCNIKTDDTLIVPITDYVAIIN